MILQVLLWSWEMMSILKNNNNIVTSGKTQQNELHLLWAKYQQKLIEVVPFGDIYS